MSELHRQTPECQSKLAGEELALEGRIKDLTHEWKQERPVRPDLAHSVVTHSLTVFDARLSRVEEEVGKLRAAKVALDMDAASTAEMVRTLQVMREDIQGLKQVRTKHASSEKERNRGFSNSRWRTVKRMHL